MKKDFICRADQLHFALEVFFKENPGWEDSFISADETKIYASRIDYSGPFFDVKTIWEAGHGSSSSNSSER